MNNSIPADVLEKIEVLLQHCYTPQDKEYCEHFIISGYQLRDDEVKELSSKVKEQDAIIYGLQEGADNWKLEYDNCRTILELLVKLKEVKDSGVITDFYLQAKPKAWEAAKEFLLKYQHH